MVTRCRMVMGNRCGMCLRDEESVAPLERGSCVVGYVMGFSCDGGGASSRVVWG